MSPVPPNPAVIRQVNDIKQETEAQQDATCGSCGTQLVHDRGAAGGVCSACQRKALMLSAVRLSIVKANEQTDERAGAARFLEELRARGFEVVVR